MNTMRWFGTYWGADICRVCPKTETPVGDICIHCEEPIEANDDGVIYANGPVTHLDCFIRQIVGSVAHIRRECGCYVPGSGEGDPPNMTKREAARAAVLEANRRDVT